jgi:hypothetical protein
LQEDRPRKRKAKISEQEELQKKKRKTLNCIKCGNPRTKEFHVWKGRVQECKYIDQQ